MIQKFTYSIDIYIKNCDGPSQNICKQQQLNLKVLILYGLGYGKFLLILIHQVEVSSNLASSLKSSSFKKKNHKVGRFLKPDILLIKAILFKIMWKIIYYQDAINGPL